MGKHVEIFHQGVGESTGLLKSNWEMTLNYSPKDMWSATCFKIMTRYTSGFSPCIPCNLFCPVGFSPSICPFSSLASGAHYPEPLCCTLESTLSNEELFLEQAFPRKSIVSEDVNVNEHD